MRLRRTFGLGFAGLLSAVQIVNLLMPMIPEPWAPVTQASAALISAILVAVGYNSNPDGTSVSEPYRPQKSLRKVEGRNL